MAELDLEKAARAFLRIRDARTALKHKYEEEDAALKAKQDEITGAVADFFHAHKIDSTPTNAGTFYRIINVTPTVMDWSAVYGFIRERDAFEFLHRRVSSTFVKDYMEEHKGAPPPGVSVFKEYEIRCRRTS